MMFSQLRARARAHKSTQINRNSRRVSASRLRLGTEPLESRQLLTATVYASDHWQLVSDTNNNQIIDSGDIVNDGNLYGANPGSIVATVGVDAFGNISSGALTGPLPGSRAQAYALTDTTVVELDPFTAYVNDHWWYDDYNPDDPENPLPLQPGQYVDNSYQHSPSGDIYTDYLWNDAANPGDLGKAGFTDLATAISQTAHGGFVQVLEAPAGGFAGSLDINAPVTVQGSFTVNGDLTLRSGATLSATRQPDLQSSYNGTIATTGDLSLSAGSTLQMNLSGTIGSDLVQVAGNIDLGGATLDASAIADGTGATLDTSSPSLIPKIKLPQTNYTLIENNSNNDHAVTGTFAGLPEGAKLTVNGQTFWITYEGHRDGTHTHDVMLIGATTIEARNLFYKGSTRWDVTNNNLPGFSDDNAIAPDKSALLPGDGNATFANVSSYSRGINGIMVDIAGSHGTITANDFDFKVGNNNNPALWAAGPAPTLATVRAGAGAGGSDRVELIWADNAIEKEWLMVSMLSNSDTRLAAADVFFFGNALGDSGAGDNSSGFPVNSSDEISARNDPHSVLSNPAPITNVNDFNRDGNVNSTDEITARNNPTGIGTWLKVIEMPTVAYMSAPRVASAGDTVTVRVPLPTTYLAGSGLVPDPTVTRMDFYNDVNGNGLFDPGVDALLTQGTETFDSNSMPNGWSGDISMPAADINVLAVPVNASGAIGAAISKTVHDPTVIWQAIGATNNVTATGAVTGTGTITDTGPNHAGVSIGQGAGGGGLAWGATAYATNDVYYSGGWAQIFANAATSAGVSGTAQWAQTGVGASASFSTALPNNLTFVVGSTDLPIGAPIVIRERLAAVGFGAGGPGVFGGGGSGGVSVTINNPGGQINIAGNFNVQFPALCRVGQQINVVYVNTGAPLGTVAQAVVPPGGGVAGGYGTTAFTMYVM